jgi:hypothetical protein
MASFRYKIILMRACVQRCRNDGVEPPAEVIWQATRALRPGLSKKEKQRILFALDTVQPATS